MVDQLLFESGTPQFTPLPKRRGNVFARVHEWFWRSRSMRALSEQSPAGSPRASELLRRARLCLELADRALTPAEPLENGSAEAIARELLRQSVYWSLRAERYVQSGAKEAVSEEHEPGSRTDISRLWQTCDAERIAAVAGGEAAARALEVELARDSFATFADLPLERQRNETIALRAFASALLGDVTGGRAELERMRKQRLVRSGGALAIVVAIVVAVNLGLRWHEHTRDLARGKPWRTSSWYSGCGSPAQRCLESQWFFFHTQLEDSPWVEFDLQRVETFSSVRVVNRLDCCQDRAHPLVIEASRDQKTWTEVARRTQGITEWRAEFPTQSARWVRVRSLKKTMLHLKSVRILP